MAGKLLLGNRTIALLFSGETPIQQVMLGGRVVWASLLRLPAGQRSAIKTAILSEGSTAEADGVGIGLRAVFVSDSSASLLGVGGFSTGQAGRMEYKISPILITVCKPRFDGTARIREKETAQLYCSGGMAYRDRAGVREQYTAYQAGMVQAGQETEATSRFTVSGDTAGMDQLAPASVSGVSTARASVLTSAASTAEAGQAARSSARGAVNPSRAVQSTESAGTRQTCTVSIQLIRDGTWAEQKDNALYIYQADFAQQLGDKLVVI